MKFKKEVSWSKMIELDRVQTISILINHKDVDREYLLSVVIEKVLSGGYVPVGQLLAVIDTLSLRMKSNG